MYIIATIDNDLIKVIDVTSDLENAKTILSNFKAKKPGVDSFILTVLV